MLNRRNLIKATALASIFTVVPAVAQSIERCAESFCIGQKVYFTSGTGYVGEATIVAIRPPDWRGHTFILRSPEFPNKLQDGWRASDLTPRQ